MWLFFIIFAFYFRICFHFIGKFMKKIVLLQQFSMLTLRRRQALLLHRRCEPEAAPLRCGRAVAARVCFCGGALPAFPLRFCCPADSFQRIFT